MTEIEFLDQFISPAPSVTPAYYVMYRGAKDELFLELQSTEKLSVKAQQLAASDGIVLPTKAKDTIRYMIKKGAIVCAFAQFWGENDFINQSWRYGPLAADRAKELVKVQGTKRLMDGLRQDYEVNHLEALHKLFPEENAFPFTKTAFLDEAAGVVFNVLNDALIDHYENTMKVNLNGRMVFWYPSVIEDIKEYLLKTVEQKLLTGQFLHPGQKQALQCKEAEMKLGHRYSVGEIEAYEKKAQTQGIHR